jgi:retinol dehydrogenase-13
MQFGVNHLGHFLLTNLLLDKLKESPSARIVNVSSLAYKRMTDKESFLDYDSSKVKYEPWVAYRRSKLANVLFTRSLAKRLTGESVIVNCLHPGVIMTELGRHFAKDLGFVKTMLVSMIGPLFFKSVPQGAQTTIHCAISEEVEGVSGKYFADCKQEELATELSRNDEVAERLWADSISMVGLGSN